MSASDCSNDCQDLYEAILNEDHEPPIGNTDDDVSHGDSEDDILCEFDKEYESDDSVGGKLQSEKLASLLNKMFRYRLSDKSLREKLERQERPQNCESAKPTKVNIGIWRRLGELTKKRDVHLFKIQQALVKGIYPIARIADIMMSVKQADKEQCQDIKKLCLESLSLLTYANYENNMQRRSS